MASKLTPFVSPRSHGELTCGAHDKNDGRQVARVEIMKSAHVVGVGVSRHVRSRVQRYTPLQVGVGGVQLARGDVLPPHPPHVPEGPQPEGVRGHLWQPRVANLLQVENSKTLHKKRRQLEWAALCFCFGWRMFELVQHTVSVLSASVQCQRPVSTRLLDDGEAVPDAPELEGKRVERRGLDHRVGELQGAPTP